MRNCRRTVHVMPVWIRCCCRGTHGYCEHFMPIGLYVRRHSNQLYRVQSRRVVHNVRPGGCIVYRRHWDIRIHRGVCYGIGCSCWPRVRAGYIIPHPPSCSARHPPPTEPPTQTMFARGPVVAVGIRVWYRSGTLLSIIVTTPALRATPPQRGTLARDGTYQVPLHWRGGRSPGWLESSRKRTYSPYSVIPAQAGMTGERVRERMPTAFGGGCRALHDGGGG